LVRACFDQKFSFSRPCICLLSVWWLQDSKGQRWQSALHHQWLAVSLRERGNKQELSVAIFETSVGCGNKPNQ
jgi:hypothetical protein